MGVLVMLGVVLLVQLIKPYFINGTIFALRQWIHEIDLESQTSADLQNDKYQPQFFPKQVILFI